MGSGTADQGFGTWGLMHLDTHKINIRKTLGRT
jgi:hypothetical protein